MDSETLQRILPKLGGKARKLLWRVVNRPAFCGKIRAPYVDALLDSRRTGVEELMMDLLPLARSYSYSPLSHYQVGAVARGAGGSLYLGANIEVPGQALGLVVHAEQCAVANAFMQEESGLTHLAVSAAPCGHCRQFLNEPSDAGRLSILVEGSRPAHLATLLPQSFGPANLGVPERLMMGVKADLEFTRRSVDALSCAALDAARRSYAPYTKALSGVAVLTTRKRVFKGSYIENAAYNPSLSPLQVALAGLVMGGEKFESISAVALVEMRDAAISQRRVTQAVLDALAPGVRMRLATAQWKGR